jgi:hypothetical protein
MGRPQQLPELSGTGPALDPGGGAGKPAFLSRLEAFIFPSAEADNQTKRQPCDTQAEDSKSHWG